MIKVQITTDRGKSNVSAWTKAPADVAKIADAVGFERVAAGRFWPEGQAFVRRVFRKLRLEHVLNRLCWKLELASLRRKFGNNGGELLLQHPLPPPWTVAIQNIDDIAAMKRCGVRIVVLVHDVGALRGASKEVGGAGDHSGEIRWFKIADRLIVHNDRMAGYVKGIGVSGEVVALRIFDYLVNEGTAYHGVESVRQKNGVLFVGGFGSGKARFVQDLKKVNGVVWTLYGHDFNPETMGAGNVGYLGKFDASCPPVESGCRFGLVWDGRSVETCSGPTGEYLRTNNPHKLSLYLSMGLPVIVWKEAAVAKFVQEHGVGVVVGSLYEIPELISSMSDETYALLVKNARDVADKLRNGDFTKVALGIMNYA